MNSRANPTWKISYHEEYLKDKQEFDSHVIQLIEQKEIFIQTFPLSNPPLKYKPYSERFIRKYKSGKIRIFYILSTERPDLWKVIPQENEIRFLLIKIRGDDTYEDAKKMLKREEII